MTGLKKIALLTDGVFPLVLGGMQKHSLLLLTFLLKNGVEVILYHPGGKGKLKDHINSDFWHLLMEVQIPFPRSGVLPGTYLRRSFRYSLSILEDIKKQRDIDFIYGQGFTAWALINSKQRGESLPKIGVNFHGLEMFQDAYTYKQKLIQYYLKGPVKYICKHADVVYSLGGRLTELIKKNVPTAIVSEIPIGLSEDWMIKNDRMPARENSPRIVLFVGRQEHRKGLHLLYKVLNEAHFSGLEFHFIGPLEDSENSGQNIIERHGEIRNEERLKETLDKADFLIVPSLSEGMPTVILEGMARGLVILATDVGAINELVDESNGLLIVSNDAQAIAGALEEAQSWTDEELASKSQISRSRFHEHFTWEKVIQRTLRDIETRTIAS